MAANAEPMGEGIERVEVERTHLEGDTGQATCRGTSHIIWHVVNFIPNFFFIQWTFLTGATVLNNTNPRLHH